MEINKERLAMELAPKVEKLIEERIMHRVVKAIIEGLEEEFYPPEEMIRGEFVREVESAESKIKQGKYKAYSYQDFKAKFCEQNAL